MATPLPRLTRRSEYLRVAAAGRKWVAPGLILQVLRREAGGASDGRDAAMPRSPVAATKPTVRLGFTASRKVGIAVRRNRARRRLRAAAAQIMPCHAAPGHDYVLIARAGTPSRRYATLVEDLRTALRRLGVYREGDGATCGAA